MRDAIAETKAVLEVDGEAIDTSGFSYSSDVLAVGDPFSATVPNPRGRFTNKLNIGASIRLKLANAEVNGGVLTLKHTGRIIEREATSDESGTRIQLNCADLGWHLANCCPPVWYNLQQGTFLDLFSDGYIDEKGNKRPGLLDPSWGLVGETDAQGIWNATLQLSNLPTLQQRKGEPLSFDRARIRLNKSQAVAANVAGIFKRVFVVQTEPGDKVFDVLSEHARRFNLLVNVSCDGYIQVWNPDFTAKPTYRIDYHDDEQRQKNNILRVRLFHSAQSSFTEVTCVGEIVAVNYATLNPNDFNAGKVRGTISRPGNLPFVHRKTFCDGEMFDTALAQKQAEWHYKRGLFDTFIYEVTVKGHHQNGVWWESDTMCAVDDAVTGVRGNFYVASVRYERSAAGDVTHVTMRLPNTLSAAFGVLPVTPYVNYSPRIATALQ